MASHALGAPAYSAKASGLAASEDLTAAVASAVDWAVDSASPAVRDVLQRLPPRTEAAGALAALVFQLDCRLADR